MSLKTNTSDSLIRRFFRASYLDRMWRPFLLWLGIGLVVTAIMTYLLFGEIIVKALYIAFISATPTMYIIFGTQIKSREILEAKNKELEELNQLLSSRNDELDAFAHTVAHDLKNPLHVIIGYGLEINNEASEITPEVQRKYIDLMVKYGNVANDIIDSLLLLSSIRDEAVEIVPLSMQQIIEQAWERQQPLREKYDAVLEVSGQWPEAVGYAPWVEAIWSNYLSNAIKYGGRPALLEVGGCESKSDKQLRFWVRDNGLGLSEDDQEQLFIQFGKMSHRVDGHGLGLSIVQRIAHRLNGRVGVESKIGEGCLFYFTLPSVLTK